MTDYKNMTNEELEKANLNESDRIINNPFEWKSELIQEIEDRIKRKPLFYIAPFSKAVLINYAILVIVMCLFFTPHNLDYVVYSSQDVPHVTTFKTEYHPIWYNTYESKQNSYVKSSINYPCLLVWVFSLTVIAVLVIFIYESESKKDLAK